MVVWYSSVVVVVVVLCNQAVTPRGGGQWLCLNGQGQWEVSFRRKKLIKPLCRVCVSLVDFLLEGRQMMTPSWSQNRVCMCVIRNRGSE